MKKYTVVIKDDNLNNNYSIQCNKDGCGALNHLQWKASGIKNGVKYTANIKNVKVLRTIRVKGYE